MKWFSFVIYKENLTQPPFMGVMVGSTQLDYPHLPPGAKMLGKVRSTRAEAIDEAINFLQMEKISL